MVLGTSIPISLVDLVLIHFVLQRECNVNNGELIFCSQSVVLLYHHIGLKSHLKMLGLIIITSIVPQPSLSNSGDQPMNMLGVIQVQN